MRRFLIVAARGVLNLAVIVACVATILHFARRREIECAWQDRRASCTVEVEDSLGRVEHDRVDGVRGVAYRAGSTVGLVTDAQHMSELALFGTREVEAGNDANAARLVAFAVDQEPERLSIHDGVAHPRLMTALMLLLLLGYSVVTQRLRRR